MNCDPNLNQNNRENYSAIHLLCKPRILTRVTGVLEPIPAVLDQYPSARYRPITLKDDRYWQLKTLNGTSLLILNTL